MTEVRPAIALLIDADNAALGSLDQVLSALAEHGDPIIRRAYGNWFKPALKAWDPELNRRGIRPVQQSDPVKGKNATDLAMVIDAVDLHHTIRPDAYALVSSDSDYTPLAHFLRERGVTVIGFGRAKTAQSFRAACTFFVPIPDAPAGEPKSKPEPKRQPKLPELLTGAIAKNADKQGWARVSAVANYMRQKHGQSARTTARPHGPRCSRVFPATSSAMRARRAWLSVSRRASSQPSAEIRSISSAHIELWGARLPNSAAFQ